MFHKHDWREIVKTYAPPTSRAAEDIFIGSLERLTLGLTTILWKCRKCQAIRKEEMLGKEVVRSEEIRQEIIFKKEDVALASPKP